MSSDGCFPLVSRLRTNKKKAASAQSTGVLVSSYSRWFLPKFFINSVSQNLWDTISFDCEIVKTIGKKDHMRFLSGEKKYTPRSGSVLRFGEPCLCRLCSCWICRKLSSFLNQTIGANGFLFGVGKRPGHHCSVIRRGWGQVVGDKGSKGELRQEGKCFKDGYSEVAAQTLAERVVGELHQVSWQEKRLS